MHRPPAVSCHVARSLWHLAILVVLWCMAAMVTGLLLRLSPTVPMTVLLVGILASAGLLALRGWYRSPTGRLSWDGQCWYWAGFGGTAVDTLAVVADFQRLVLVRLAAEQTRPVWVWLECGDSRLQWIALRRALVSSAGAGPVPSPAPDSA